MITPSFNHNINYRPEIDGLRAIAVLSVIFYHAGFGFLPYGFLGVDIFFVISGYLITSILLNDLAQQQFSLVQFYERRARRILPALTLVLIVTTIFAWFWLLPHELERFGDSLFSTSLFHSNLYFANQSGYFEPDSQELPLLHTWSLSVEEQFYFVFPLLLFAAYKFGKKLGLGLLVVGLVSSFAYFLLFAFSDNAIYYLPYTRAWELMLGVVCAVGLHDKTIPQASIKQDILPLLGLLLIYLAMTVKLKYSPYNFGVVTLQACLGTAVLIYFCRADGLIKLILSSKYLVFVGLISYSAYLWHNPILAFSHTKFNYQDGSDYGYLIIVVTLLLAWATYKFVEQPFRNKSKFSRRQIFSLSLVSIIGIAALGFVLAKNEGFADRANMQGIQHYLLVANQNKWITKQCKDHKVDLELGGYVCLVGDPSKQPTGAIWGDSLAGSMMYGVDYILKKKKKSFIAIISDGCPPIVGLNKKREGCTLDINIEAEKYIVNSKHIEKIIWIGSFQRGINSLGTKVYYYSEKMTDEKALNSIFDTAEKFIKANKKVYLVTPAPVYSINIPTFYMRQEINSSKNILVVPKENFLKEHPVIRQIIDKFNDSEIKVVDTAKFICDDRFCRTKGKNDNLFYIDKNHFSHEISLLIANEIFNK